MVIAPRNFLAVPVDLQHLVAERADIGRSAHNRGRGRDVVLHVDPRILFAGLDVNDAELAVATRDERLAVHYGRTRIDPILCLVLPEQFAGLRFECIQVGVVGGH